MEVISGDRVRAAARAGMAVLAIDASTDRAVVALDPGDGLGRVAPVGESRRHGRGLLPSVRDLLRAAGLRPGDLDAIVVGLGPGSFTGVRVALTASKTLAYAIGIPLFGVDSLAAVAANAPDDATSVVVIADAQRGDLFVAEFRRDGAGAPLVPIGPTRMEPLATWPTTLSPGTFVLGLPLGRAEPDWPAEVIREMGLGYPDGTELLAIARDRVALGDPLDPFFSEPAYHRRGAAEEKADR